MYQQDISSKEYFKCKTVGCKYYNWLAFYVDNKAPDVVECTECHQVSEKLLSEKQLLSENLLSEKQDGR